MNARLKCSVAFAVVAFGSVPVYLASQTDVVFLGDYSHFRQTSEHAYGYSLELWQTEGELVGLWSVAEGQAADMPTVKVQRVTFDKQRGLLQFWADWCDDHHSFEGVMRAAEIVGELRIERLRSGKMVKTAERLTLTREDDEREPMGKDAWERRLNRILLRNSPRCR